jgi:hypothetical protein
LKDLKTKNKRFTGPGIGFLSQNSCEELVELLIENEEKRTQIHCS